MPALFTYFDKSPEGIGAGESATVPAPLAIAPNTWTPIKTEGNLTGALDTGRSLITRQSYFRDFTDTNAPSAIKTRLVRHQPDGTLNHTAETNHPVAIDLAIDHCTEMATQSDTPLGWEMLVTGPGTVYLVAWGFRGVSIAGEGRKGIKATLQGLVAAMKAYADAL